MSISWQAHVVSCALLKHHVCVRQLLHGWRWSAAAHTPGSGLGCSSDRSGSVAGAVAVLRSAHTGPGIGHDCGSRAAAPGLHVVMRQASRGIHCGITCGDRAFRAAYNASLAEPQLPLTPQAAAAQTPVILHGGQPWPLIRCRHSRCNGFQQAPWAIRRQHHACRRRAAGRAEPVSEASPETQTDICSG